MGYFLLVFGIFWVSLNFKFIDATLWIGLASLVIGFLGISASRSRGVQKLMLLSFTLSIIWLTGEVAIRSFIALYMKYGFVREYQWVNDQELKYIYRPNRVFGKGIKTNSLGMCDREYTYDKPEGMFRIAVVGDSLTACGPKETMYTEQLKELFARCKGPGSYEVMNFGVNGYNTRQEARITETLVMKFHPDLIVVSYVLNDPYPHLAINPFVSVGHSKVLSFLWQRIELFSSSEYRNESFEDLIVRLHTEQKSWNDVVRRGFSTIASVADRENVPVVVVIFPLFSSFDSPKLEKVYQIVESEARSHGFGVINLLHEFEKYQPEDVRMPGDMFHCNARGHKLAATTIFNGLQSYCAECLPPGRLKP